MKSEGFDKLLEAIQQAHLTQEQRQLIADALKRPKGRPKEERTIGDLIERYDAAITMRQLQHAGVTYDEAAELAAESHNVNASTLKSWVKRYGLREMADQYIQSFDEPRRRTFSSMNKMGEVIGEADALGVAYASDWPISRIKAEIERSKRNK